MNLLIEKLEFLQPKINPKIDVNQSCSGDIFCKSSEIDDFEYAFSPKFNYAFTSESDFYTLSYQKSSIVRKNYFLAQTINI